MRFLRHVATTPPEGARVLMRFTNDTPLMWEQPLGSGRLLVFASPLDRQWNDLAIHPPVRALRGRGHGLAGGPHASMPPVPWWA